MHRIRSSTPPSQKNSKLKPKNKKQEEAENPHEEDPRPTSSKWSYIVWYQSIFIQVMFFCFHYLLVFCSLASVCCFFVTVQCCFLFGALLLTIFVAKPKFSSFSRFTIKWGLNILNFCYVFFSPWIKYIVICPPVLISEVSELKS